MKKILILSTFIITIISNGADVKNLYESISKEVMGWEAKRKDKVYNRKTLFEYIDGGAELYLTYQFKQVFVRRFEKPDFPDLILEIFDMTSSNDAFGIFSCEREDEDVGIGQQSEYGGGLLRFWQDRFFVSILATDDEQSIKSAIFQLGQQVATLISSTGSRPALLKLLPEKELIAHKIRFFHTHPILNRQYFLANENILKLTHKTDCVLAPYHSAQKLSYLLMIRYETSQQAEEAYKSFLANYLPEAIETGFARMENNTWTMVRKRQQFVLIVLEAPDEEWASKLLFNIKWR